MMENAEKLNDLNERIGRLESTLKESTSDQKNDAEKELLVRNAVRKELSLYAVVFGVTNFTILVGALIYVMFYLPTEAVKTATASLSEQRQSLLTMVDHLASQTSENIYATTQKAAVLKAQVDAISDTARISTELLAEIRGNPDLYLDAMKAFKDYDSDKDLAGTQTIINERLDTAEKQLKGFSSINRVSCGILTPEGKPSRGHANTMDWECDYLGKGSYRIRFPNRHSTIPVVVVSPRNDPTLSWKVSIEKDNYVSIRSSDKKDASFSFIAMSTLPN